MLGLSIGPAVAGRCAECEGAILKGLRRRWAASEPAESPRAMFRRSRPRAVGAMLPVAGTAPRPPEISA